MKASCVHCIRIIGLDKCILFIDINTGENVALKLTTGTVVDLRVPPFLPIIPCPHCGTFSNKDHFPEKHIDKSLGMPTPGLDRLQKWIENNEARWERESK